MTAGFAATGHLAVFADFAFANPVVEHILHHFGGRVEVIDEITQCRALMGDQIGFDVAENHAFLVSAAVKHWCARWCAAVADESQYCKNNETDSENAA